MNSSVATSNTISESDPVLVFNVAGTKNKCGLAVNL
jgi:hypothetical protein